MPGAIVASIRSATLTIACCALLAATAAPAEAARHDWTRFGFGAARSNSSTAVAGIAAADLSHLVRQDVAVPGTVDSSPLYLHDSEVMGRVRDVFVATSSYGRTFALAARTGKILWTYTPPSYDTFAGSKNITTASPVADRKRGYVYSPSPDGLIRKLSLRGGREVLTQGWPAAITRDAVHEKISSPLNLSHGYVIATTASYGGDIPPYQGHVALVDRDSGALAHVFNALCSRRHELMQPTACGKVGAGIWARSGAVVVPGSHRLLVTTGNGNFNGATNWGDTVLELSPDAEKIMGSWTPTNQTALDHFDFDLGSTAPALLRSGKGWLALQGGKDGTLRLLDVADLNGHGRACQCTGGELQQLQTPNREKVMTAPASWRHKGHSWVFVTTYQTTTAFRLSGKPPRLHRIWGNNRPGSSPVVAGGLLYVYDPVGGGVAVYRPDSGNRLAALATDDGHWSSPVVADGRIAIPVGNANLQLRTGTLTIYREP
jgi:outer membrane protein assembly factor BamB